MPSWSVPSTPPVLRPTLRADLERLGVAPGDILIVHASLRAIGWVCGGATEAVGALLDAVGPTGTVVVPAQTPDNRDPSRWDQYPDGAFPPDSWDALRDHLPPFDPRLTPSAGMGALAERVRTWPGAVRSAHPQTSFAAVGPAAAELMAEHTLESQLGEQSPLAALVRAGARVLLLGVDYRKCTAFHLAEYRIPNRRTRTNSCVVLGAHGREWVTYSTVLLDDGDFAELGADFEARSAAVRVGLVGAAESRLFPIADAVEHATKWIPDHRS